VETVKRFGNYSGQAINSPHPLAPSPKKGEGETNPFKVPLPPWERETSQTIPFQTPSNNGFSDVIQTNAKFSMFLYDARAKSVR